MDGNGKFWFQYTHAHLDSDFYCARSQISMECAIGWLLLIGLRLRGWGVSNRRPELLANLPDMLWCKGNRRRWTGNCANQRDSGPCGAAVIIVFVVFVTFMVSVIAMVAVAFLTVLSVDRAGDQGHRNYERSEQFGHVSLQVRSHAY